MQFTDEQLREAVKNCDRDPVHIPGTIQSFGVLLATDPQFDRLRYVSANAGVIFGHDAAELVGAETSAVFTQDDVHAIRNVLGHDAITRQRETVTSKLIGQIEYQLSVHRKGDTAIVELVPEALPAAERVLALQQAQSYLSLPLSDDAIGAFLHDATARLRALTGYDRMKFYQFLPDDSGEVVAEARDPRMASFLGLRFPATDMPPIARALYATTPIRVIHSNGTDDVPVLSEPGAEPLDMSLALLRGKDAVHRQYLDNMGVASTLTLPVVIDGRLWGLFAGHSAVPVEPDPAKISAAELVGKLVSLRLQHSVEARRASALKRCTEVASRFAVVDDSAVATSAYWHGTSQEFMRLIPSVGVVFAFGRQILTAGDTPDEASCRQLLALGAAADEGIALINDLAARLPDAELGETAGAAILYVPSAPQVRMAFLRNRAAASVQWAGRPEKGVSVDGDLPRLNPRSSFETYLEETEDRSLEWSADDAMFANALRIAILQSIQIKDELDDNRQRLGLIVSELNHRVRNLLALIQSISHHSQTEARSVEEYAESLEQRLLALAGAHDVLTQTDMAGAPLREMVETELKPFDGRGHVTLNGPDIVLQPDAVSIIALLLHELVSNAAKYGALSVPKGKVAVTWARARDGIELVWRERDGPPVSEPHRAGFGTTIIRDAVPYEFGGQAALNFDLAGLHATFWLPGSILQKAAARPTSQPKEPSQPVSHSARMPESRTALIVEDSFIIAAQTKHRFERLGFSYVATAGNVAEALHLLATQRFDFCLLDVSLRGEFSTKIADVLVQNAITFAFATGHGSEELDMVRNYNVAVLKKPLTDDRLRAIVDRLMVEG
ncbi:MAG: HWE histidine kinase domain-containing protein [Pseudomonadota bacterium]